MSDSSLSIRMCAFVGYVACLGASPGALAQRAGEAAEIRAQIEALRAEQEHIADLQRQTDASIRALKARIGLMSATAGRSVASGVAGPASVPAPSLAAGTPASQESKLKIAGDFRLREQSDYSEADDVERKSMQVRGRLGATYALNPRFAFGARLVTGDPDDPNSTDIQLSNWNDDLQVALDLAYAQVNLGDLKLYGGKLPQPFTRTDLVWDGDVNPQGAGAVYKRALRNGSALRANALLFTLDERTVGDDSTMAGLQLGYDSMSVGAWKYELSAGYYAYELDNVAGADAGDFRSNLRNPEGSYVSDYELIDVVGGVTWQRPNSRWPVRIVGDYVKNLGAVSGTDTGFGVDVGIGRASQPGDWRFTYGYSQTDVDAVLAAFSHDNIALATNYQLHALTVEYTPIAKTAIAGIWYHYSPLDAAFAGTLDASDWLDRVRLYVLMSF